MTKPSLNDLHAAIRRTHGCALYWLEAVPVTKTWQGEVVWDGLVEVFTLRGHPTAKRAYAWSHQTDEGQTRYVAVLHKPPVDSPQAAVREAIAVEPRENA